MTNLILLQILIWCALGYAGGWIAARKGYHPGKGVIVAVIFGPIALVVSALLPTTEAGREQAERHSLNMGWDSIIRCRECGAGNPAESLKCIRCGSSDFDRSSVQEFRIVRYLHLYIPYPPCPVDGPVRVLAGTWSGSGCPLLLPEKCLGCRHNSEDGCMRANDERDEADVTLISDFVVVEYDFGVCDIPSTGRLTTVDRSGISLALPEKCSRCRYLGTDHRCHRYLEHPNLTLPLDYSGIDQAVLKTLARDESERIRKAERTP